MRAGDAEGSSHCSSHRLDIPWVRSPQGGIQLMGSLRTVGMMNSTAGAEELSVEATYDGNGGCSRCRQV